MLIGVFELLVDARERVAGVNEYIQALRDFWIASGDLQTALTIGSPGAMASIRSSNVMSGSGRGH